MTKTSLDQLAVVLQRGDRDAVISNAGDALAPRRPGAAMLVDGPPDAATAAPRGRELAGIGS